MSNLPSILIKIPASLQYVIMSITALVSLFATQGLIENRTEKLVSGSAAILIPLGYLGFVSVLHMAHARVTAARITAGQPTTTQIAP